MIYLDSLVVIIINKTRSSWLVAVVQCEQQQQQLRSPFAHSLFLMIRLCVKRFFTTECVVFSRLLTHVWLYMCVKHTCFSPLFHFQTAYTASVRAVCAHVSFSASSLFTILLAFVCVVCTLCECSCCQPSVVCVRVLGKRISKPFFRSGGIHSTKANKKATKWKKWGEIDRCFFPMPSYWLGGTCLLKSLR